MCCTADDSRILFGRCKCLDVLGLKLSGTAHNPQSIASTSVYRLLKDISYLHIQVTFSFSLMIDSGFSVVSMIGCKKFKLVWFLWNLTPTKIH